MICILGSHADKEEHNYPFKGVQWKLYEQGIKQETFWQGVNSPTGTITLFE